MSPKAIDKDPLPPTPMAVSTGTMEFNHTGSWRYLRPTYEERLAPCRRNCPAGTDIPKVLHLISDREFEQAYHLITGNNPLPATCGRVCYHPCQDSCTRSRVDTGVSVQSLERFVGEFCLDLPFIQPRFRPQDAHSVGIVGSGPAGLSCAYFLALHGFDVRVYEAEAAAGGMLRVGIPSYRLPKSILDQEIRKIRNLGVDFLFNCRIGRGLSFEQVQLGHDAVFVATGAHKSKMLNWQGIQGVWSGLEFLRAVNLGARPRIGKMALILGGGNTAIDAARTAIRLGSEPVIIYRRSRDQMPAHEEEILQAEQEGIDFLFLASPTRVSEVTKRLEVEFQEMKLGEPDSSGRARPVPIPGASFTLEADSLIIAIGEDAEAGFKVDVSRPEVFLGGDAATGPGTVVAAIATGKKTAYDIMGYLGNGQIPLTEFEVPRKEFDPAMFNSDYFPVTRSVTPSQLSVRERIGNFGEVIGTLNPSGAVIEARRCISCGVCDHCDNCWLFCPEAAVVRSGGDNTINLDYCKGCGICAQECPRGVISLVEEET